MRRNEHGLTSSVVSFYLSDVFGCLLLTATALSAKVLVEFVPPRFRVVSCCMLAHGIDMYVGVDSSELLHSDSFVVSRQLFYSDSSVALQQFQYQVATKI